MRKVVPKRKICVITGTRADYGLLKPLIEKIKDAKSLELQVLATGMHLLPEFGLTIKEIEKDGFKIDAEVPMIISGDEKISMVSSIGVGVIKIAQALDILDPDIVVILGDRFEAFSGAIAASFSGRIVAHLSGGDSAQAGYDEYARHAITKIAHFHFPTTKKSAERIIKLGEPKKYVFPVGSTSLDTILNKKLPSREYSCKKYHLKQNKPIILLVQHSVSANPEKAANEIQKTLEAVVKFDCQIIVIYPNVDPGGRRMIKIIEKFKKDYPRLIKGYKNLPFEDYLGLMRISEVMVGNSSSGIIEAPSFHLPVVNIGPRQKGRERADNIIDVDYDKKEIIEAIKKAIYDKKFRAEVKKCENPYGDGKTSERIVKILSEIKIGKRLLQKKITY